jgi:hypothetical protein
MLTNASFSLIFLIAGTCFLKICRHYPVIKIGANLLKNIYYQYFDSALYETSPCPPGVCRTVVAHLQKNPHQRSAPGG